jgi:VIT1/CCC1 family predicted Fe2+/Mn2+ transporter/rubrerythrin
MNAGVVRLRVERADATPEWRAAMSTDTDVTQTEIDQYRANLQAEVDGVALYRTLAELEPSPELAQVYQRFADAEQRHAAVWRDQLRAGGVAVSEPGPGWRTRVLIALARRFGPGLILSTVAGHVQADSRRYAEQPEAQAAGMSRDERSHARLFREIGQQSGTGMVGGALAQLEGRHRAGGNALRAAVLGANDGLVSNASLVMGVAGAELAARSILVTGLAGLLAGSLSMALGEWLSVQSARELYAHQIEIEREELAAFPEEESEELALIYRAKGVSEPEARALATQVLSDQSTALETLVREELTIDPAELGGSAWVAAITSFILFSIGAIIPVAPYFVISGMTAAAVSIALSALALFVLGAGITVITGQSALTSGVRQVAFGVAAAAITYGVGRLVGVGLSG